MSGIFFDEWLVFSFAASRLMVATNYLITGHRSMHDAFESIKHGLFLTDAPASFAAP